MRDVLKKYWGYDDFLPLQPEAIQCALERRDSLVVLPTGGGKSICYQLPAVMSAGLAVVISPLISLMKDQVDGLRACGIPAAALNSSLSAEQKRSVHRELNGNRLRLLYLAPERLLIESTLATLAKQSISFIAVDEAHCISVWGHDFRPEYRELSCLRQRFPGVSLHAFTATATDRVRSDIIGQLGLFDPAVLIGNFHRKNLIYHVQRRESGIDQIRRVMERYRERAGIIYAISRAKVEQLSDVLNRLGFRTLPYHAGLADDLRVKHQDALVNDEIEAIVATVAFGMGIDKSNVRYVIHAEMPKSIENYQQESGRAGRDGLPAECWLFFSAQDTMTWKRIIEQSSAEMQAGALASLQKMYEYCGSVTCRHRQLIGYFGQELKDPCQGCDVCLGKLQTATDPAIVGQKILSCILRCVERFGADHITKVLTGSHEDKVLRYKHDKLSTWGLMKDESRGQIRDWIDQLTAQGFIEKTGDYAILKVTAEGRRLLRGEVIPTLFQSQPQTTTASTASDADVWEGVDRALFDQMRMLRRHLADRAEVPAYVIFTDATLRELAFRRPVDRETLTQIPGIGDRKANEYGPAFLELIERHCREHQVATNVPAASGAKSLPPLKYSKSTNLSALQAFDDFDQGMNVSAVAQKMNRASSTVFGYLVEYILAQKITDATRWVDPADVQAVETVIDQGIDLRKLRPIHDALNGRVSFESIRLVLACRQNRLG